MKGNRNSQNLAFLFLLMVFFDSASMVPMEARKHQIKKNKHKNSQKDDKGNGSNFPAPVPCNISCTNQSKIFNVLSFGAKGDGVSDDSKPLLAAWKAACKVTGAIIEIPSEHKLLIKPITLQGPCMPHLVLQLNANVIGTPKQIDGTLLAPPKVSSWLKYSLFQWINFKFVQSFTILGSGTIDGQGFNWWQTSSTQIYNIQKNSNKHIPNMKPTALRFYFSDNITLCNIKIINSPQCHLKFDNSTRIHVNNITISSPEDSPNTDGIHLQNSQEVEIQHSNMGCGDDCVSIQTGCSNVHIHHINCGPGHGISLGGLGKDNSVACVSNIMVEDISIQNTLSGLRIKTWQGGMGSVKNVSFSNIQVSDVMVPIMIDQYYCDKNVYCKNQTRAVEISGVRYNKIVGTYTAQPIHLACSNQIPCTYVDLIDIQLKPSSVHKGFNQALCWNSYGKIQAPLFPSEIDNCLQGVGGAVVKRIAKSHEHLCSVKTA